MLRRMREQQGLTVRDVQARSRAVARKMRNRDYEVGLSALWEIENTGKIPHVYRLTTLATIYGCSTEKLLALYKVRMIRRR